jgi:hypothetical protein
MSRASTILVLLLSTSATIILGLQDLEFWAGLGFSLVAVATALTAVEPYFAWRFRWVLMEEMQQKFYRLAHRVKHYVASFNEADLTRDWMDEVYADYEAVWDAATAQRLEHRRHGEPRI